jgi:hypothetical protein
MDVHADAQPVDEYPKERLEILINRQGEATDVI